MEHFKEPEIELDQDSPVNSPPEEFPVSPNIDVPMMTPHLTSLMSQ